jgi:hypothetical protein
MAESQLNTEGEGKKRAVEIDIVAPLVFWIALLLIGLLAILVFQPVFSSNAGISALMTDISNWILYLPGSVIMPLIVAIWIGERAGSAKNNVRSAVRIGEINAVYATLIYVVAVFIIYLLFYYISPMSLQSKSLVNYAEYVICIPAAIILLLVPVVSALSAARHNGT